MVHTFDNLQSESHRPNANFSQPRMFAKVFSNNVENVIFIFLHLTFALINFQTGGIFCFSAGIFHIRHIFWNASYLTFYQSILNDFINILIIENKNSHQYKNLILLLFIVQSFIIVKMFFTIDKPLAPHSNIHIITFFASLINRVLIYRFFAISSCQIYSMTLPKFNLFVIILWIFAMLFLHDCETICVERPWTHYFTFLFDFYNTFGTLYLSILCVFVLIIDHFDYLLRLDRLKHDQKKATVFDQSEKSYIEKIQNILEKISFHTIRNELELHFEPRELEDIIMSFLGSAMYECPSILAQNFIKNNDTFFQKLSYSLNSLYIFILIPHIPLHMGALYYWGGTFRCRYLYRFVHNLYDIWIPYTHSHRTDATIKAVLYPFVVNIVSILLVSSINYFTQIFEIPRFTLIEFFFNFLFDILNTIYSSIVARFYFKCPLIQFIFDFLSDILNAVYLSYIFTMRDQSINGVIFICKLVLILFFAIFFSIHKERPIPLYYLVGFPIITFLIANLICLITNQNHYLFYFL